MLKKVALFVPILFLSSCFETKKYSKRPSAPKKLHILQRPIACKNHLCIYPINKITMLQTFIDNYLAQGYKPSEILVIFDVDETLLTSYAAKNHITKQIRSHDLFPYIANTILVKNLPPKIIKHIGIENVHINKPKKLKKYINQSAIDAVSKKTYDIFTDLYKSGLIYTRPLESKVGKFTWKLQHNGIYTMGLTARGMDIKNLTLNQLKKAGIDLTYNTIYNQERYLLNKYHGFSEGFLFSTPGAKGFDKGNLLIHFFDKIKYQPTIIIFVDDNLHFLQSVQVALLNNYPNIIFNGLLYTFKPKNVFDKELAESLVKRLKGSDWWSLDNYYSKPIITKKHAMTAIH